MVQIKPFTWARVTANKHTFLQCVLAFLQFSLGVDGKKLEPESNVLLASIENMQYAVTLDVLQTVPTLNLEKTSRD